MQNKIGHTYKKLLKKYDPQGWWPLLDLHGKGGTNPTKTGNVHGYHPGDYTYPRTAKQKFEICCGAILTQAIAWPSVERALLNLQEIGAIEPERLASLDDNTLRQAIKPTGYFNQKAKKLREFTKFYISLNGRTPRREELLNIWGVGPETADSMLLYAFKVPTFVVDAYTRRIFSQMKIIKLDAEYDAIKALFEKNLPRSLALYQEYHALIVEHGKRLI